MNTDSTMLSRFSKIYTPDMEYAETEKDPLMTEHSDLSPTKSDTFSDSTLLEVVDSPSLLDDTSLKKALDEADQDYAIPIKPQVPRIRISRPNIRYVESFYTQKEQQQCLEELLTYNYESISFNVHGRTFTPKRKVLAFADSGLVYSFSGVSLQSNPWSVMLKSIKEKVEKSMNCEFNHALLNFYPDGTAKLSQHKDNEDCVDTSIPVVTLSFGVQRDMQFTKKGEKSITQPLHPGSLLVMYNQQWNHGIMPDFNVQEPRISISFRKLIVPDTVQPSETFSGYIDVQPAQDMADPNFIDSFPDAQRLTPDKPPAKRRCPDSQEDVIPDNDWLTNHYQRVHSPPQTDIQKFWISDRVALAVQVYEGDLCIYIREYTLDNFYETTPTPKGVKMNMFTFFELCQKLPTFSKTLAHSSESCILNNCLMLNIKDRYMHLRQFDDAKLYPHEIVLSPIMFQCLCSRLSNIIDFVLNYQFDTLLKSQVSLPLTSLHYMEDDFHELRKIVRTRMQEGIRFAFICPDCVSGATNMFFHKCRRLSYSQKFAQLPYYAPMMVNVGKVARDYLNCNSEVNFASCDFTRLFKHMY